VAAADRRTQDVNGLLLEHLETIRTRGTMVRVGGYEFEVLQSETTPSARCGCARRRLRNPPRGYALAVNAASSASPTRATASIVSPTGGLRGALSRGTIARRNPCRARFAQPFVP